MWLSGPSVKKEDQAMGWAGTWIVELDYTATVDVEFWPQEQEDLQRQGLPCDHLP